MWTRILFRKRTDVTESTLKHEVGFLAAWWQWTACCACVMHLFTAADLIRSIASCDFDFLIFFFFWKIKPPKQNQHGSSACLYIGWAVGGFGVCKLLPETQGSKWERIGWHCQGSASPQWLGSGRRRRAAGILTALCRWRRADTSHTAECDALLLQIQGDGATWGGAGVAARWAVKSSVARACNGTLISPQCPGRLPRSCWKCGCIPWGCPFPVGAVLWSPSLHTLCRTAMARCSQRDNGVMSPVWVLCPGTLCTLVYSPCSVLPPGHAPVPIPCHFSCPSGLSAGRHSGRCQANPFWHGRSCLGEAEAKNHLLSCWPWQQLLLPQPVQSLSLQGQPWGPGESRRDLSVPSTICSSLPWH